MTDDYQNRKCDKCNNNVLNEKHLCVIVNPSGEFLRVQAHWYGYKPYNIGDMVLVDCSNLRLGIVKCEVVSIYKDDSAFFEVEAVGRQSYLSSAPCFKS